MYDNAVTLFVKGARLSLPTFDGRQSGDIRFQFRTTATSGLFLRNDGIGKDFIEVRLVTNRVVNFRYDVGNGIQLLSVESSSDLNDNEWHTVQMERNRKEARLRVDQNTPIIRAESSQGHRALSLGDNPLYVGSDVDYKDGFVGCIRAFTVNGVLMDLVAFAEEKESTSGSSKTTVSVGASGDLVATKKLVADRAKRRSAWARAGISSPPRSSSSEFVKDASASATRLLASTTESARNDTTRSGVTARSRLSEVRSVLTKLVPT